MNSGLIDLHVHTSASDGTYSPGEIVRLAREQGLKAIAITDHDTINGNAEAMRVGLEVGLEVIPGVEISVEWNKGPAHILGYYVNEQKEKLALELQSLLTYRKKRNRKMIEKLNSLGMTVSYEEVKERAGEGTVGRPHFAQVLIAKGYVRDEDDAFKKYLRKGASAYVEKKRLTPEEGIQLIRSAGGTAVLAHPFTMDGIEENKMEAFILDLKHFGIEGVEVFYPIHTQQQTLTLRAIAKKHNLLMTGGSDFHGEQKPKIHLGRGFGSLTVHYELLAQLKQSVMRQKS